MPRKPQTPGVKITPEAVYVEECFAARQRLLGKGPEASPENPGGLSPGEALLERVRYVSTCSMARANLRASLTPPPTLLDTAVEYSMPAITLAAWVWIGWMFLMHYLAH